MKFIFSLEHLYGHIFGTNELEMGRSVVFLGFIAMFCLPGRVVAQIPYVLGIDSIAGLPDTLIDGEEYTFYVEMTNASPLAFQGDSNAVKLMLEYNGVDVVEADSTTMQSALVAPAGNTLLQVSHRFSSGGGSTLGIGINVVVVWPRINDGIDPPQEIEEPPYSRTIWLLEPNSILESKAKSSFKLFPNPSTGTFALTVQKDRRVQEVRLIDLSGRMLKTWTSDFTSIMNLESALTGNFIIEVRFEDGSVGRELLVLR